MKASAIIRRNEKAVPERGRQSQKAQIETPSCSNTPSRHPHLSTSKLSDQMAEHLIGALVMKSLIQLERGHCHGV